MVGDICSVDWLSEQLQCTGDDADGTTAAVPDNADKSSHLTSTSVGSEQVYAPQTETTTESSSDYNHQQTITMGVSTNGRCPNCPHDRRRRVVILDCRSPTDYLASHIVGAVHLAIPQLMLRRLTSGHLPASSVIGCLQDEGRENFNRRWKSEIIVLHDERSHGVMNDFTSCSTPPTPSYVISVLLRRLKEDGCEVCLLEGGYEAFSRKYPHLCVTATSASSGADDLENDDGINVDEGDEDDFTDESCRDIGPSPLMSTTCSSAPPTSSTVTTALGLQRLRIHRHNRHNRPIINHRLQQQVYHHHGVHHQHLYSSCSDHFSCPSSLSSSSLSSCCSSANSSNSSSSSSLQSISSCPVMASSAQHQQQQHLQATSVSFPVEVLPYLYLGNARSSADIEALHRNGIRYILNVTPDVPNSFEGTDAFHYLQIPIDDHWSQDLTAYFPDAIAFIDEARRGRCGVLVHCLAGVSRSVTVTVAYLMHAHRLSLNDAFDHVRRCKPDISPNFSFMGQLLDYERLLSAERDRQLISGGEPSAVTVTGCGTDMLLSATGDDQPQPLAAVAEPVGDQSMFLSPPPVATRSHNHRSKQQQQQQQLQQHSAVASCDNSYCTTGAPSISGAATERRPHCDMCCHQGVCSGIEVRMTPDLTDGVSGVVVGGVGSSCYSSPVSSLSSLSSSSAANAAASSTSSSSSSAFDYEIPMASSPSPHLS